MLEFKKVVKTYETNEVSKCICDRCGKECTKKRDENNEYDMRTYLKIDPKYILDESCEIDLCPECTNELLKWFTDKSEDIKNINDSILWYENNIFNSKNDK